MNRAERPLISIQTNRHRDPEPPSGAHFFPGLPGAFKTPPAPFMGRPRVSGLSGRSFQGRSLANRLRISPFQRASTRPQRGLAPPSNSHRRPTDQHRRNSHRHQAPPGGACPLFLPMNVRTLGAGSVNIHCMVNSSAVQNSAADENRPHAASRWTVRQDRQSLRGAMDRRMHG